MPPKEKRKTRREREKIDQIEFRQLSREDLIQQLLVRHKSVITGCYFEWSLEKNADRKQRLFKRLRGLRASEKVLSQKTISSVELATVTTLFEKIGYESEESEEEDEKQQQQQQQQQQQAARSIIKSQHDKLIFDSSLDKLGVRHANRNSDPSNIVDITDSETTELKQYVEKYLLNYSCNSKADVRVLWKNGYIILCGPKNFMFSPVKQFSFIFVAGILRQFPLAIAQLFTAHSITSFLSNCLRMLKKEFLKDVHENSIGDLWSIYNTLLIQFNFLFKLKRWPVAVQNNRLALLNREIKDREKSAAGFQGKITYLIRVSSDRLRDEDIFSTFTSLLKEFYESLVHLSSFIHWIDHARVMESQLLENWRYSKGLQDLTSRPEIDKQKRTVSFREIMMENTYYYLFGPGRKVHELVETTEVIGFTHAFEIPRELLEELNK